MTFENIRFVAADSFFEKRQPQICRLERDYGVTIALDQQNGNPPQVDMRATKKENFDLIVMGHSGHSQLSGRLLGHNTDRVSENAHCDVLIVRQQRVPVETEPSEPLSI